MNELFAFTLVFALAFCTTLLLTPLAIYLGHRFKILAIPGGRRKHPRPVSTLGGISVFGGFVVAAVAAQWLPIPRFDPYEVIRLTGLLLGGGVIFVVGVLDDIYELEPLIIGIGQIIAAGCAILFQVFIETINNPFTAQQTDPFPALVTVSLTMLWIGVMTNTVNFMDGLDGLVGGVAFITGAVLFINGAFVLQPAQTSVSLLPLAMMGASMGFLMFNFYPAQIFLGGGAYFLGYLISTLSIIGGAKMAAVLMVMGLPLMDFTWQVFNRIRQGRNPMRGDRGHLHFRLHDLGIGQRQIVVAYYLFCACFGVLTLVITSQLFKFIAFGTMVALIAVGFAMLSRTDRQLHNQRQPEN